MNTVTSKIMLALLLALVTLAATGCSLDRSNSEAVSEATLRAVLAKDFEQLQRLVEPGASIPTEQEWKDASFIRDRTPSEGIKNSWTRGPIAGYVLSSIRFEDYQQPKYAPGIPFSGGYFSAHGTERIALVDLLITDKAYMAVFPIILQDGKWSPGQKPGVGDFFIRFEEPAK